MIVELKNEAPRKVALLEVERVLRYGPSRGDGRTDARVVLHAANAMRSLASLILACDDQHSRQLAAELCRNDPDVRRVVGMKPGNRPIRLALV